MKLGKSMKVASRLAAATALTGTLAACDGRFGRATDVLFAPIASQGQVEQAVNNNAQPPAIAGNPVYIGGSQAANDALYQQTYGAPLQGSGQAMSVPNTPLYSGSVYQDSTISQTPIGGLSTLPTYGTQSFETQSFDTTSISSDTYGAVTTGAYSSVPFGTEIVSYGSSVPVSVEPASIATSAVIPADIGGYNTVIEAPAVETIAYDNALDTAAVFSPAPASYGAPLEVSTYDAPAPASGSNFEATVIDNLMSDPVVESAPSTFETETQSYETLSESSSYGSAFDVLDLPVISREDIPVLQSSPILEQQSVLPQPRPDRMMATKIDIIPNDQLFVDASASDVPDQVAQPILSASLSSQVPASSYAMSKPVTAEQITYSSSVASVPQATRVPTVPASAMALTPRIRPVPASVAPIAPSTPVIVSVATSPFPTARPKMGSHAAASIASCSIGGNFGAGDHRCTRIDGNARDD